MYSRFNGNSAIRNVYTKKPNGSPGSTKHVVLDSCVLIGSNINWVSNKLSSKSLYVINGVREEVTVPDNLGITDFDADHGVSERVRLENEVLKAISYGLGKTLFHRAALPYLDEIAPIISGICNSEKNMGGRLHGRLLSAIISPNSEPGFERKYHSEFASLRGIVGQIKQNATEFKAKLKGPFCDLLGLKPFKYDQHMRQIRTFDPSSLFETLITYGTLRDFDLAKEVYRTKKGSTRSTDRKNVLAAEMLVHTTDSKVNVPEIVDLRKKCRIDYGRFGRKIAESSVRERLEEVLRAA